MNLIKNIFVGFFCVSFMAFTPVWAQTANGGRDAFDFLNLSPISRAVGVGEAYSALGDDVGSVYYNPAGLASILTNEMNITYLSLYQQMNYEFIAFATPLQPAISSLGGVIALSVGMLQPGNMSRTNDSGVTTGTFSSGDQVFTLAYAKDFSPTLHVGVSLKLLDQQIDTIQSSLFAVDAGLVVIPPSQGLRIGLEIKNLGAQASGFNLPFILAGGLSYRQYELFSDQDDGAITGDVSFPIQPIEDPVGAALGMEYNYKWIGNRASIRVGYKFQNNGLGGEGITLGAGYGLDLTGAVLFLDYAFAPADVFGDTNRLSLTTKF
jgi:hypothetical protein